MPVEPKPMHDLPAHHLVPDALTPEQIESKAEHVAISKANMPSSSSLCSPCSRARS